MKLLTDFKRRIVGIIEQNKQLPYQKLILRTMIIHSINAYSIAKNIIA